MVRVDNRGLGYLASLALPVAALLGCPQMLEDDFDVLRPQSTQGSAPDNELLLDASAPPNPDPASGGNAGMGGTAGAGGSAGNGGGGASGSTSTPALPAGAATVSCNTTFNGSLDATDPSQRGRHSRIVPISACGVTKRYPGNSADPSNPHLFDVYRFANPTAAAVCFSFTLSYGAAADAGAGNALDVSAGDTAGGDAAAPAAGPARYLTAYTTFYPTDISMTYLGDVGDKLVSPQTLGITVPANETIDVVVYAVDVLPGGVGPYTLSCATQ
jgi:hypothetical protein